MLVVEKGHWANDRECAMSSSKSSTQNQTRTARMATRQQPTDRANQIGACFVRNEYSDDPDTSAYMVGQNVPLSTEPTEQISLTPTASAAVDIKNTATFDVRAMGDRGRPQDRLEQNVQEWDVSWYAVWNCFARFSETSCITGQGKKRPCKRA